MVAITEVRAVDIEEIATLGRHIWRLRSHDVMINSN